MINSTAPDRYENVEYVTMIEKPPFLSSNIVQEIIATIHTSPKPLIVSICGGSCSGKSTLAKYLKSLGVGQVLSMDSYYKIKSYVPEYLPGIPAFDSPEAFDMVELKKALVDVRNGEDIRIPIYRYSHTKEGRDAENFTPLSPTGVTFLDGLLSYTEELREYVDWAIYVERVESDRRQSRIVRDVAERGVTAQRTIEMFDKMAVPLYHEYVYPQKERAHFVVMNDQ